MLTFLPIIRYPAKTDIRFPGKLLAGYPAKSVSCTTLFIHIFRSRRNIVKNSLLFQLHVNVKSKNSRKNVPCYWKFFVYEIFFFFSSLKITDKTVKRLEKVLRNFNFLRKLREIINFFQNGVNIKLNN